MINNFDQDFDQNFDKKFDKRFDQKFDHQYIGSGLGKWIWEAKVVKMRHLAAKYSIVVLASIVDLSWDNGSGRQKCHRM